jgi:hypothetical protein
VSYDLEVLASVRPAIDLAALAEAVAARTDLVKLASRGKGLAADGGGFVLEATARGAKLVSAVDRGVRDEWGMELCAWLLAGDAGTVLDRHTGRNWPAQVLGEWLAVGPLFSGRAAACNHERIAHVREPVALAQFAARVDAMVRHCAEGACGAALRARVHDELAVYVSRAQFTWVAARALGALGDFAALEQLTRTVPHGSEPDPFVVLAGFGGAAVPVFARALADADPNHRRAAARALHHVAHDEVFALVKRALEDKRSTVREAVLEAEFDRVMARPGAREALGAVLARLVHDPSTLVRRLAGRYV